MILCEKAENIVTFTFSFKQAERQIFIENVYEVFATRTHIKKMYFIV